LWTFMTEGHSFDTPERRAALEFRINEVTQAIADEAVRKYYRQDFNERLRAFFAPQNQGFVRGNFGGPRGPFGGQGSGFGGRQSSYSGNWPARAGGQRGGPQRGGVGGPYVVASQQMAASPVHR